VFAGMSAVGPPERLGSGLAGGAGAMLKAARPITRPTPPGSGCVSSAGYGRHHGDGLVGGADTLW
jgi:hypothetical protein